MTSNFLFFCSFYLLFPHVMTFYLERNISLYLSCVVKTILFGIYLTPCNFVVWQPLPNDPWCSRECVEAAGFLAAFRGPNDQWNTGRCSARTKETNFSVTEWKKKGNSKQQRGESFIKKCPLLQWLKLRIPLVHLPCCCMTLSLSKIFQTLLLSTCVWCDYLATVTALSSVSATLFTVSCCSTPLANHFLLKADRWTVTLDHHFDFRRTLCWSDDGGQENESASWPLIGIAQPASVQCEHIFQPALPAR